MSTQFLTSIIAKDGPEVDLPAIERGNYVLPGLVFTILVFTLLGITVMKLMDPATLPIRHVSVAGDFKHLSPPSLEQRVGRVVRGGFFNVNVDAIQQALLQEPWVREVSVKRIWPDRITVIISEQVAVAKWGDEGLLNPDAELFYPDSSTFPEGLTMVSGPVNTTRLVLDNFLLIQQMLPEGLSLYELYLSERRSWQLKLSSGTVIRLGKSGVIDRMERLLSFFPVSEPGKLEQIDYIDMRYTNGFAIRWNPEIKPDLEGEQQSYGEKI